MFVEKGNEELHFVNFKYGYIELWQNTQSVSEQLSKKEMKTAKHGITGSVLME